MGARLVGAATRQPTGTMVTGRASSPVLECDASSSGERRGGEAGFVSYQSPLLSRLDDYPISEWWRTIVMVDTDIVNAGVRNPVRNQPLLGFGFSPKLRRVAGRKKKGKGELTAPARGV